MILLRYNLLLLLVAFLNCYGMQQDNSFNDTYGVYMNTDIYSGHREAALDNTVDFDECTFVGYLCRREIIENRMPLKYVPKVFHEILRLPSTIEGSLLASDKFIQESINNLDIDKYRARKYTFINKKKDEGFNIIPYNSKYFGKHSYFILPPDLSE